VSFKRDMFKRDLYLLNRHMPWTPDLVTTDKRTMHSTVPPQLTYLDDAAAWYKQGCTNVGFSFRLTETIPEHPKWRDMLSNLFQDLSSDLIQADTRIKPSTWMGIYRNLVFMQTAVWCVACMRSGTSGWRVLLSMESNRKPSIVHNIVPDALACHHVEGSRQVLEAFFLDRWTFEWWFLWICPYMCGLYRLISFAPRVLSLILYSFADSVHHRMHVGLLLLSDPFIIALHTLSRIGFG
jgi:hypothetical protein